MWSVVADIVDGVSHVIDMVTHPRFYVPVLVGIAIAFALWRWMLPSDARDVLVGIAVLGGVAVGFVWDWGR
jgi:hypothetical protein